MITMKDPNFFLESVVHEKNSLQDFEGPLSLILMLLQKNKIEIRDIQVSEILDQYLAYLEEMERMDLEIASEFVQMAAHLLYIKTKTLLSGEEEENSELELLMSSLEQLKARDVYESLKQVLPELKRASEKGLLYFSKLPEPIPKEGRMYEYRHEPVDLLKALQRMYERGVKAPEKAFSERAFPQRITYSVRDKSRQILNGLRTKQASLRELYYTCRSRSEVVATFLSVLQLCSMGSIKLIRRDDDYEVIFVGGEVEDILERMTE